MRVAVIGAGNVGKALGEALRRKEHEIVYGVRDAKRSDAKPTEAVEKQSRGPMPLTTPPVRCSASMQRCLPEKW